jgi:hypothetical protein
MEMPMVTSISRLGPTNDRKDQSIKYEDAYAKVLGQLIRERRGIYSGVIQRTLYTLPS